VDSAAVAHFHTFGRTFGGRCVGMVDRKHFTVYGTPSAELRRMLDQFGATYLEPFGGSPSRVPCLCMELSPQFWYAGD
jgi:hypothetical protein